MISTSRKGFWRKQGDGGQETVDVEYSFKPQDYSRLRPQSLKNIFYRISIRPGAEMFHDGAHGLHRALEL